MPKRGNTKFPHKASAYGAHSAQDNKIIRETIHGFGTLSSSAGGIIAAAVPLDPGTIANSDWADFNSTYDEVRVIGARLTLVSMGPAAAPATLANGIMAIAFDNDSSVNPSTFTTVQQYGTCQYRSVLMQHNQGLPLTLEWWRPTSGKETSMSWIDIASTTPGSIQIYASGLTASTTYFQYTVDLYCEFRGRR